jgi:hypothetical protein
MNYNEYFDVVFLFPLLLVYKFILDFNWLFFSYCQNETLIAIKAPHGTTLEVPDPDEVI